jgi:hypothetical protein
MTSAGIPDGRVCQRHQGQAERSATDFALRCSELRSLLRACVRTPAGATLRQLGEVISHGNSGPRPLAVYPFSNDPRRLGRLADRALKFLSR